MLAARWAYYHHTTQCLPQGAGPKRSTPVTSTWPVHKAMGDEGFVTESIACVLKVHEIIGPEFELGRWSLFLVLPSSWGMESHSNPYKTTPAPKHLLAYWTTCSNNQHLAVMCRVCFWCLIREEWLLWGVQHSMATFQCWDWWSGSMAAVWKREQMWVKPLLAASYGEDNDSCYWIVTIDFFRKVGVSCTLRLDMVTSTLSGSWLRRWMHIHWHKH